MLLRLWRIQNVEALKEYRVCLNIAGAARLRMSSSYLVDKEYRKLITVGLGTADTREPHNHVMYLIMSYSIVAQHESLSPDDNSAINH